MKNVCWFLSRKILKMPEKIYKKRLKKRLQIFRNQKRF